MPGIPLTTRRRILLASALLSIVFTVAGVGLMRWYARVPPDTPVAREDDPRRTYRGPYRNIHPDVHYVGSAACFDCHADIARSFSRHPMGRSLTSTGGKSEGELPYGPEANNPFTVLGRRFQVERQGNRLWHRQTVTDDLGRPVAELNQEVGWAIGSGHKGYSYITEREGYLLQTSISWFAHERRWDLSPGFGPPVLAGRIVTASCLFCHANRLHQHPDEPDRFVPPLFDGHAIGCERCHGPGELHIQGDFENTIVNPERLTPSLRDAVCEQCHLEGEARVLRARRDLFDYRPGLPLNDFWAVLVRSRRSGEDDKAVNHVEQMYQSKCFQRPVGGVKLGCITCHDPHVYVGPPERATHYRTMCLKCHDEDKGQTPCSESISKRRPDDCIACHMPRYSSSDIPHTASTDHRIVRRPERRRMDEMDLERAELVDFYRDRFPQGDPQSERTLGLGLIKLMDENMLDPRSHADRALRFLESALANDPTDRSVRAGKVEANLLLHRPAAALSEAEFLVPEQPRNWQLLAQAAFAAQADGRTDRAQDYWRRVVEINPLVADYRFRLVVLLIQAGQLAEARKHCEELLRLDPFNVGGRQALASLLLQQGRRAEAQQAFEILRKLKPP